MNNRVIAVVGATASGKTSYAIELAKKINGEIVSADSMQIYKREWILGLQNQQLMRCKKFHII